MQGDLLSLKQGVHKQLQQLDINAAAAANSVALLKEVDTVKGRMEAACSTLKVKCMSCLDKHMVSPVTLHGQSFIMMHDTYPAQFFKRLLRAAMPASYQFPKHALQVSPIAHTAKK